MKKILARLLECETSDLKFLEDKIKEWRLKEIDIIDEAEDYGHPVTINSLIYVAFRQAGEKFLRRVETVTGKLSERQRDRYLGYIDCSYKYSSFDSPLDDYDLMEPSEVDRFIEDEHLLEEVNQ